MIADIVFMKEKRDDAWQNGMVTSINPLRVNGKEWFYVEAALN